MEYHTYAAGTELTAIVKCYWTLEGPKQAIAQRQTIVPDGCMEMIFHHGAPYKQYLENGSTIVQPKCFVIGQLSQPLEIEPTGRTGIFSVRFHPDGFSPFAGIAIKEMENTAVSLEKLFGHDGKKLEEDVLKANSVFERIECIKQFLTKRIREVGTKDRIIKSLIETIWSTQGQMPVGKLSEQSNVSYRQLERRFSSDIGMSPKQFSKIIRLQTMLKKILSEKFTNITSLAYEGEYYDQAHFIKDFKKLTGYTPKQFYGENLKMSSLFYGND